MSIHQEGPFVGWLIGVLSGAGLTVGDGVKPAGAERAAGYCVVYSLAGGATSGSLEAPRSDAEVSVQVTSSGTTAEQVRWLADRVRTVLDAAVPAVLSDGRKVIWLDFATGSPPVTRENQADPVGYYSPDRFEMGTA